MDTADRVMARLTQMFRLPAGSVRPDVTLQQLRIDSLALEELRLALEDELRIDLDEVHLSSRSTVAQLVAAVCAKSAAA